jgi:two-component system nitrate/nitrite response regulator NarL
LSDRETGIIRHLAAGESNKAIALALNIREATVKTHVKKILKKLGLANRTQAAVWAIARGLDKTN